VFQLTYKNAFSLFTYWGQILSLLEASGEFNQFGEDVGLRGILASRESDRKGRPFQLAIRLNSLDGSFEEHPFKSLHPLTGIFRQTNEVLSLLNIQEYMRVGVRFFFLGPQIEFEEMREKLASNVAREYLGLFEHKLTDLSIITIHEDGNERMRVAVGPIRRNEFKNWFATLVGIEQESTMIFDVDCSATPFKAARFDLEKLVSLYYSKSLEHVELIGKLMMPGA